MNRKFALVLMFCSVFSGAPLWAQAVSTATPAAQDWAAKTEQLRQDALRAAQSGQPLPPEFFDSYFNDGYFSRRFDPFEHMENLHRRMRDMFKDDGQTGFDRDWDNWFSGRMDMRDFKTEVARTDTAVTVTIEIPNLQQKSADININADRIKISFNATFIRTETKNGVSSRSESTQSYTKILPIPADADAATAKTSVDKDKVIITFTRKTV